MFLCQHTLLCISEGLSIGEVIAIIFGVLLLLAALVGVAMFFIWRSEYFFLFSEKWNNAEVSFHVTQI